MDCKRILRCSALVVLVLVTLVNAQSSGAHKRDLNNLYQVIYYGDSQVEVGKPFSISCIISIANPVEWHKDGEPIRKHSNIRHGKDEHSYIESEMGIAGNRDKIEASISVQRALPKHQGRYQCNALYKNYHQLYVYRNGTLLGHGAAAATAAVPGPSRGRDELQVLLSTVKSTLVAPLQQPIEHHHFTTAVALAPGPPIVDEELPREHERDRESPKGGHSPHHHRQQAGQGHRHHTATGEKQPDHSSPAMGKDDSKRFVSQKTTTIDQNGLLEQTQVEDLDRDFAPVLHNTDHRGASPMMGKGSKKQHSSAGRVHVPVETREEDEDEQEEMIGGGDVAEAREGLDLDTTGTDADHAEDLIEPDTEIVIESKAISLEDENIDRLIQNKSDINGIILVDSLEELATLRKQPSSALLPILPTREAMLSNGSSGFSLAVSTVGPMLTGAVSKDGGSAMLLTSVAPPLEQDNTVHHNHHHHHHEHHGSSSSSSSTAAKMATTLTATTSTTTTTASTTTITTTTTTSTTTTTAAPPATTTIAAADVLLPNYDQASTSLKIFDIAKALTLGCNITQEGNFELSWAKDGKNVSEVESLKDRFKILAAERKFVISRALETDAGQYTCSVPQLGVSKSFNVVANVVVKFESTEIGKTNIVEGERLTLHCIAYGTDPKITWTVGNNTYNASTDHIVLEEDERGVENAKLIIDSIKLDDYADYTCEARNNATEFTGKPAQVLITVRVRGKYAALYVFLGIIVEVVLLCAIILICEKRRNKTEIEESDTDQSPDQRRRKASRNYN